jgi:hypothetical protein
MRESTSACQSRTQHRPDLEVADIFRVHGHQYQSTHPLTWEQKKVMHAIQLCRTAGLGGHIDVCDHGCGYIRISYNSCRNRHCPKCQNLQQARWLHKRMQRLLPTHYFHMVLTLPHELNPLILQNKKLLYDLLFHAASRALLDLARGYRRLGAVLGFTAVLHTWDQELKFHPHLHIVATGGGIDPSAPRWISSKNSFLVPVKALSKIFRGKLVDALHQAYHQGKLQLEGAVQYLQLPQAFTRFVRKLRRKKWVVYSKEPFGGPQHVFQYVSRYTHRVAISNQRLVRMADGSVTFRARDNSTPGKHRLVTLCAHEFIRRFLLHVLPPSFVRIRHYGLLAPCNAKTKLEEARRLILHTQPLTTNTQSIENQKNESETSIHSWQELMLAVSGIDLTVCPQCGGNLIRMKLCALLLEEAPTIMDSS